MSEQTTLGYKLNTLGTLRDVFDKFKVADKAISTTKGAVQGYIESFLNPNGVNRHYLTSSSSPVGLQFVTELTYDDQMLTSPNLRKTYLARFFAENTGRLPSILLIDTGIEHVDAGINELSGVRRRKDGQWEGLLTSIMNVSISITIATLSEEDTSTLSSVVHMMFSPLATIVNNCIIANPEQRWEVRLPLTGMNIGQASSINVEGDSKSTIWTRAVDLVCNFENIISVVQPMTMPELPPIIYSGEGKPIPKFLNLVPNQDIPLGMSYPLYIQHMLREYRLGVEDPSIALVTSDPPYFIQPKAQGRTRLLVFDTTSVPSKTYRYQQVADIPFNVIR